MERYISTILARGIYQITSVNLEAPGREGKVIWVTILSF